MSRRRTVSTSDLLPLSDPEAIIRAANAARRHLTQTVRPTHPPAMTDSPGGTNSSVPHLPDDSYRAWFRLVIKAQHAALVQNDYDRRAARETAEANKTRIARLEELVLALAVKAEEPPRRTRSGDDELDLQKFRTSDGPKFLVAGVAEDTQFNAAALASIQAELTEDGLFRYATEDLEGCYGRLDSAGVAGYEALDIQRWANENEKAQEEAEYWANVAGDIADS
ncbi:hypothetical protein H4Q26_012659 [Puccinia striiformis f. sp. tritici PST-130]|nr:hypothetical protein H4Q26_012659 [Puccinia striiformis f. sp. tritici PST-130]